MARPKAITKLSQTDSSGKKNWLIYSDSGVGKTVLAGTAPKALFLTVEAAGTESAAALGSDAEEWVVEQAQDIRDALKWLKDEGFKEFDWVIIDSLSEMEELLWKEQLGDAAEKSSSRSVYQPAIQDYPIVDNKVKALVDSFNRLPVNVLYTAHTMRIGVEDSDGDDVEKLLPLIGRTKGGAPLSNKICGKVTLVGLLTIKRPKKKDDEEDEYRRLTVAGSDFWVAKDRHDTFDRYINRPNIAEMDAAVEERRRAKGPKVKATKAAKSKAKKAKDEDTEED